MTQPADILCLSHLRWNFVYQRPNHLMARAAQTRRVFFIEEPERRGSQGCMESVERDGVITVRPVLPERIHRDEVLPMLRDLVDDFVQQERVTAPWLWYYTPMAMRWTAHLRASAVVYDCMDELANFRFAPAEIGLLEQQLICRATVVFTGGRSLFDAKKGLHANTFCFPSSVDVAHFGRALDHLADPVDQAAIARPRVGYYGVIDERIDLDLIADVATARPEIQFVMVGPLAKIREADVPITANLHWLGMKTYDELPSYLAGWDAAMMPFALNDSTRFISPTKTPEYLAGGKPVVSTPITDVVHPYADEGLVRIASTSAQFATAIDEALRDDRRDLQQRAGRFLANQSWDATWEGMERLVEEFLPQRSSNPVAPPSSSQVKDRDTALRETRATPARAARSLRPATSRSRLR